MVLIFSTPLALYSYDLIHAKLETLAVAQREFFGITWDKECIFLSHSNIDNASLKTETHYRSSGQGYVRGYFDNGSTIITSGLSMPHQILSDSRGRLLATNTGFNSITVIDLSKREESTHTLNEIDCDVIGDEKRGNHFNSFFEHNDFLYVVAHNNSRKSAVYELDLSSLTISKVYETQAEWAHNIWICEHGMIICDSKNGSLYEVYSGETLWKAEDHPIITRGIASTEDYLFIGRSEYGDRLSRRWSNGGFWIVDRKSLKTIETVKLPSTGCINEMRLVDVTDYCHNAPVLTLDKLKNVKSITPLDGAQMTLEYFIYKFMKRVGSIKIWPRQDN